MRTLEKDLLSALMTLRAEMVVVPSRWHNSELEKAKRNADAVIKRAIKERGYYATK